MVKAEVLDVQQLFTNIFIKMESYDDLQITDIIQIQMVYHKVYDGLKKYGTRNGKAEE